MIFVLFLDFLHLADVRAGATDFYMSDIVGGKSRLASNDYTVSLAGFLVSVECFQRLKEAPAIVANPLAMFFGLEF
jgi:hypothetical protein